MRLDKRAVAPDHDKTGIFLNLTDNYPVAMAAWLGAHPPRKVHEPGSGVIWVETVRTQSFARAMNYEATESRRVFVPIGVRECK